jgi:MerR family transcriptional regulator/heat shock protein HspR
VSDRARRLTDGSPGADSGRRWRERLADVDEPLYTLAVTADLLDIDTQVLRRLEVTVGLSSERPSGNQRRFSRRDLERLGRAAELLHEGTPREAIARILDLEHELADLKGREQPGQDDQRGP